MRRHRLRAPLLLATAVLVVAGAFLAWRQYASSPVAVVAPTGSALTRAARRDLYQDDVNETVFMRTGVALTQGLDYTDRAGVDGTVGGLASWIGDLSTRLRRIQNGFARSYALTMLAGVVLFLGAVWVVQ